MNANDQMLHITLADGMVRGLLLNATRTVAEAAAIHVTSRSPRLRLDAR